MNEFKLSDGEVELQLEDHRSNPPPDPEDVGKKFIPLEWVQIRWLRDLTMQIRSNENEEWKTVYKLDGHNHQYDHKSIRLY